MTYDAIVCGTGFASSFFLERLLTRLGPKARVLVLERGQRHSHAWQVANQRHADLNPEEMIVNRSHWWNFTVSFGGASNSWWGSAIRLLPSDFQLRSLYGVGRDWPISYNDLEPYYCQAERIMAVAGPLEPTPSPRSEPFPQPPHRFSDPDRLLKNAFPETFFHCPTARARLPTRNRPACCAHGFCGICPTDAKFTILNEMSHCYADPRVTVELGATVESVEHCGSSATGVVYHQAGRQLRAGGELIAIGANGIFNPFILQRSGLDHPLLGKYLHDHVGKLVTVKLRGLENFQGSTSTTGLSYLSADGPHRSKQAGCTLVTYNKPTLRPERGKWRQILTLHAIFEDLPKEENHVRFSPDHPDKPEVVYTGFSEYARRGIEALPGVLKKLLDPLPVEEVIIPDQDTGGESHIQGTTVMGADPADSIVDRDLVHHRLRNLVLLGSSVFPSCAPMAPTLTIAALSLRSADQLFS